MNPKAKRGEGLSLFGFSAEIKSSIQYGKGSGGSVPIEIDDSGLAQVPDHLFHKMHRLLLKSGRDMTDMERRALKAIHWYSRGFSAELLIDKFLYFIFIIDLVLKRDSDVPYTKKLCDRCEKLLVHARKGNSPTSSQVNELYKLRGKVVHDAHLDVSSDAVNAAEEIAAALSFIIVDNRLGFEDKKELLVYIDEKLPIQP